MKIMPVLDLEICCCDNCKNSNFIENGIIYRRDNTILCNGCIDSGERYVRYLITNNKAHLIVDYISADKLCDGTYTLDRRADIFFVKEPRKSDFSTFFTLEKVKDNFLLLFPDDRVCKKRKFSCKKYGAFADWLKNTACCDEVNFLTDNAANIIGISTLPSRKIKLLRFPSAADIYLTYTADELEKEIIKNNLSGHLASILNEFTPKELLDYCRQRIQDQGTQLKIAVYLIYRYLQKIAEGEQFAAQNWALTAPSGMGKTEFYRALRDFFEMKKIPLPVVLIDLSRITEEGFKGTNASQIPKKILAEYPDSKGFGICFFDEADKKCIPSYGNGIDVNAAIQSNLLTLVEGIRMKVDTSEKDDADFDSNRTMFIFMGAFQDLRHRKSREKASNPVVAPLFSEKEPDEEESHSESDGFYDDLTIDDIISFGMKEELAGRITQVVNFHKLSREDMLILIRRKAEEISVELNVEIVLSESAESALTDIGFGNLGIRRPMNIIRELTQKAVAEHFFEENADAPEKVVIDSLKTSYIERKSA